MTLLWIAWVYVPVAVGLVCAGWAARERFASGLPRRHELDDIAIELFWTFAQGAAAALSASTLVGGVVAILVAGV